MDISYKWLEEYIDGDLPSAQKLAAMLTRGAYEVEGITSVGDDEIHKVLDIDVLPNRASDSLSHLGVARELAVLADLSFIDITPKPETDSDLESSEAIRLSVGTDKCRRATKRLAVDVKVGESPDWLKNHLQTLGQKSINNVVDITNYVMLELGQPVHAFDYDKLAGDEPKEITIRPAKPEETITTLDGNTYELDEEMLVIADQDKPLDIAGIKGGQVGGINESTTRVMLSVCSFDPTNIRKTSQKLNLRTDASKRFENDVPPPRVALALDRFAELLAELADARITEDICDVYPRPANPYKVGVTTEQVNNLLGINIDESEIVDILKQLGCTVDSVLPRDYVVEKAVDLTGVPYEYGASVTKDAPKTFDCSSFTSWLYVQAGVALPRQSAGQFVYTTEISQDELRSGDLIFSNTETDDGGTIHYESTYYMPGTEISDGVDHCGMYLGDGQVIHASRHNDSSAVAIENLDESDQFKNITKYGRVPEADEKRLVATIPDWRTDLRISQDLVEEVGRVYGYDHINGVVPSSATEVVKENYIGVIRDLLVQAGFSEVKTYSLVETGDIEVANPVAEDKSFLRTTLRENLHAVLDKNDTHRPVLKTDTLRVFEIGKVFSESKEVYELAIASEAGVEEVELAFQVVSDALGTSLSPQIEETVGTATLPDKDEVSTEEDLHQFRDTIFAAVDFQTPSTYPYVLRDIAVWTPAGTKAETVEEIIQESAGNLLVANNLFDTYEKEDQVSYAFKLVFQSDERTLSDEEVNEQMSNLEQALEEQKGFSVR